MRLLRLILPVFFLGACSKAPPNFLFILVDDLGYMDVGAYNPDTFYETPNVNRLAREGMLFTDGYAAAPVCSPTRASIMTGLYPGRLRTTDWFGAPQPETASNHWTRDRALLPAPYVDQLPHDETTLAEALRSAGYSTFYAGKWHLGHEGSYPEDHGFQINKGGWERGGPYGRGRYFVLYDNPRLEEGLEGEHLPARLAQETTRFLIENQDGPFLAFLSFYSVHTPLMTRPDLQAKYEAKRVSAPDDAWGTEGDRKVRLVQNHAVYAGMVQAMDEAVGTVLAALDSLNLTQNTVVFFTSDNGGLSTSEGHPTSNLPLRGGKGWLYEGGIREPFIVRWPRGTPAGSVSNLPVMSIDLLPTTLDMAGILSDGHLDGISLVPVLQQADEPERSGLFWHYPHYGNQGGSPGSAVRSGDWKLVTFFESERDELYNLQTDPGEKQDLSTSEPEKTKAMKVLLAEWQQDAQVLFPSPNPAAAYRLPESDAKRAR